MAAVALDVRAEIMGQEAQTVVVSVIAASRGSCGTKTTWEEATDFVRRRMQERFSEHVTVQYVELFSPESFAFPEAMQGIQEERYHLPVVLVDGEVVSEGKKLSEGLIARHIRQRLEGSAH